MHKKIKKGLLRPLLAPDKEQGGRAGVLQGDGEKEGHGHLLETAGMCTGCAQRNLCVLWDLRNSEKWINRLYIHLYRR